MTSHGIKKRKPVVASQGVPYQKPLDGGFEREADVFNPDNSQDVVSSSNEKGFPEDGALPTNDAEVNTAVAEVQQGSEDSTDQPEVAIKVDNALADLKSPSGPNLESYEGSPEPYSQEEVSGIDAKDYGNGSGEERTWRIPLGSDQVTFLEITQTPDNLALRIIGPSLSRDFSYPLSGQGLSSGEMTVIEAEVTKAYKAVAFLRSCEVGDDVIALFMPNCDEKTMQLINEHPQEVAAMLKAGIDPRLIPSMMSEVLKGVEKDDGGDKEQSEREESK